MIVPEKQKIYLLVGVKEYVSTKVVVKTVKAATEISAIFIKSIFLGEFQYAKDVTDNKDKSALNR